LQHDVSVLAYNDVVTTHPPTPVFLSDETCDLKVEGGEGFQITSYHVMLATDLHTFTYLMVANEYRQL